MATTAQRLKEALEIRQMKQADLSEKTGIGKSSISTYISGSYLPKQKNLYKIAKALNVSESWLMGLDVPMEPSGAPKEWWKEGQIQMDKAYAFRLQLKTLGWEYDFCGCESWFEYHHLGFKADNNGCLSPDGTGELLGCNGKKCSECDERINYYLLSSINGNTSFKVTCDDFDAIMEDNEIFLKKRLQKLLLKSTQSLFDNLLSNAAHDDEESTPEERKAGDDIMTDDSEWE